jgi:hypothetical protein
MQLEVQAAPDHYAPDVVQAGQSVQSSDCARFKAGEGAFDPAAGRKCPALLHFVVVASDASASAARSG